MAINIAIANQKEGVAKKHNSGNAGHGFKYKRVQVIDNEIRIFEPDNPKVTGAKIKHK